MIEQFNPYLIAASLSNCMSSITFTAFTLFYLPCFLPSFLPSSFSFSPIHPSSLLPSAPLTFLTTLALNLPPTFLRLLTTSYASSSLGDELLYTATSLLSKAASYARKKKNTVKKMTALNSAPQPWLGAGLLSPDLRCMSLYHCRVHFIAAIHLMLISNFSFSPRITRPLVPSSPRRLKSAFQDKQKALAEELSALRTAEQAIRAEATLAEREGKRCAASY